MAQWDDPILTVHQKSKAGGWFRHDVNDQELTYAGSAIPLNIPNDDVRLDKHHMFATIDLPGVSEQSLERRFFAGLDVVGDHHRLRTSFCTAGWMSRRATDKCKKQNGQS
jgi:hypothetical protein